jgi:hypothetical protein
MLEGLPDPQLLAELSWKEVGHAVESNLARTLIGPWPTQILHWAAVDGPSCEVPELDQQSMIE